MKHLFEGRLWTVPNLLSLFRLGLIPVIVWLYVRRGDSGAAAAVLMLSALTDALDGFIARRFHQVSALGKALDPLADKLTQLAVGICLLPRWPLFRILCLEMAVKELFVTVLVLAAIRSSGRVIGADWHGKVTTALMLFTMALHFLWPDIPGGLSTGLIAVCMGMVLLSGVIYSVRSLRLTGGPAP